MKKNILILTTISLIVTISVFTGCKKSSADIVPPNMTLLGANPFYIQESTIWVEPHAIASDNMDGPIAAIPSGTINTGNTGTYFITYTATDKAGNITTLTRTVYVVNVAGPYTNAIHVSPDPPGGVGDSTFYNTPTMTLSSDGVGKVTVHNFGNYINSNVYFDLTSPNALILPVQTVQCGTDSLFRTFQGTGTISATYNYTTQIIINYTEFALNVYPSISSQDTFFR